MPRPGELGGGTGQSDTCLQHSSLPWLWLSAFISVGLHRELPETEAGYLSRLQGRSREKVIKERKRTAALSWSGLAPRGPGCLLSQRAVEGKPASTCQRNKGFHEFPSSLIKPSSVHKWDPLLFNKKETRSNK